MTTGILMYDGTSALAAGIARDFPDAQMVAGYLPPSQFAWSTAQWDLFPRAAHVTIATSAGVNAGDVLDVEAGDATPQQTQGWIAMRKRSGLWQPTIYCNLATAPAVRTGTGPYILGRDYAMWLADWDGNPASLPAGLTLAAAKQYKSTPGYDVSEVFDAGWPHRSAPKPAPVSKAQATSALATLTLYVGEG